MIEREITDLLFLDDGPEPAALALVFDYAEPEGARQRARHAALLFLAGLVPKLLLSGGGSHPGLPESEAGLMLRVVLDLGVPRDSILVEDRSRTTFENVSLSVALLGKLGLRDLTRTILLVSCPWHMRRVSLSRGRDSRVTSDSDAALTEIPAPPGPGCRPRPAGIGCPPKPGCSPPPSTRAS